MNPHQRASVSGSGPLTVLHGEPSYINYLDLLNAWQLVASADAALGSVAAASFKHVSPAGVAVAGPLDSVARASWGVDGSISPAASAYVRARDADPKSSYGDVVAVSRPVDLSLADVLANVVSDGIVAPGFEPGVVEVLRRKKRGSYLVALADATFVPPAWESRTVFGLTLSQECDLVAITPSLLAGHALSDAAVADMLLSLVTLRFTQSNSVVFVRDGATLGVGAGQQNRVDCVRLAGAKAATWWNRRHPRVVEMPAVAGMSRQERLNWELRWAEGFMTPRQRLAFAELFPCAVDDVEWRARWQAQLGGVTLGSDGYLPFRDNIDVAAMYGVSRVVEPGNSVRSQEVADACSEFGMTLIQTGLRLFHH